MDKKRKRYEELREELFEITFTHSVEEYDPERVREIVAEMEELSPTSDQEILESKAKYLMMLNEIFEMEVKEDEELIQSSASVCAIVEYDEFD